MPIQKELLHKILDSIDAVFRGAGQTYLAILYKAMFASAYYGLLRVSEIASGMHAVRAADVKIALNKQKMKFILRTSKTHWEDDKPQIVKISSTKTNKTKDPKTSSKHCPYAILQAYRKVQVKYADEFEPFFIFKDRSPVSASVLRKALKLALVNAGHNYKNFGLHSFRAGRSVDLLRYGISVETIKKLGRWKSNAVFRYLNGQ